MNLVLAALVVLAILYPLFDNCQPSRVGSVRLLRLKMSWLALT